VTSSHVRVFSRLVRDLMHPAPLGVPVGTNCGELVERMAEARASSALVCDPEGRALGIVTEQDVTRRIAFRAKADTPVEQVMTAMRRRDVRHMPVTDGRGAVVGMLDLHDAIAAAAARFMSQIDRLTHEGTIEDLKGVKAAQVEIAAELLADNLPAPEIQALLTDINNDIHRRIVDANLAAMAEQGWGAPPVDFAVIVMGSGGRGENFLRPDQDNGFILEDYPDARHNQIDAFFIELAERMTRDLDAVGFPYCRGTVMATNPVWRKSLSQWREQTRLWTRKRDAVAILFADIFLDFRPVKGRVELARALRGHVTELARSHRNFLRQIHADEADHNVALGWFGRFVTERENEAYRGQINMKLAGTLPMVEAVRLLALKEGVEETGTLARMDALRSRGVLDGNTHDYLRGAFDHITLLLLRQQIRDFQAGRPISNFVPPESLSRRERDMLVDSFRAIEEIRARVKADFTGSIL
jgi:CBS domain-containing protein